MEIFYGYLNIQLKCVVIGFMLYFCLTFSHQIIFYYWFINKLIIFSKTTLSSLFGFTVHTLWTYCQSKEIKSMCLLIHAIINISYFVNPDKLKLILLLVYKFCYFRWIICILLWRVYIYKLCFSNQTNNAALKHSMSTNHFTLNHLYKS